MNASMSDAVIANLHTPIPILQQPSSSIVTTNPFIPHSQREFEIHSIEESANKIIEDSWNKNKMNSIQNLSIHEINSAISSSVIEFFDDLFVKPIDISWSDYLQLIIQKNSRYTYFGILFLIIALVLFIVKS